MGCCFSSEPSYRKRPRRPGGAGTQFCEHGFNIDLPRTLCPGCEYHDDENRRDVVPPMDRGAGGRPARGGDGGWELVGHLRQTPHGYAPLQFNPFGPQGRQHQRPPASYAGANVYPHGCGPPPRIDPCYLDEGSYRTRERISKSEARRRYPGLMDEAEEAPSYWGTSRSGADRSRRWR